MGFLNIPITAVFTCLTHIFSCNSRLLLKYVSQSSALDHLFLGFLQPISFFLFFFVCAVQNIRICHHTAFLQYMSCQHNQTCSACCLPGPSCHFPQTCSPTASFLLEWKSLVHPSCRTLYLSSLNFIRFLLCIPPACCQTYQLAPPICCQL